MAKLAQNLVSVEIITPEKLFYRGDVELIVCRTLLGDEGFMARHSWATKLLDIGMLRLKEPDSDDFLIASIAGGFIDVKDSIVLYTDAAEWAEDIDANRAQIAKERAEKWLAENPEEDEMEMMKREAALRRAISRLTVYEAGVKKLK